MPELPEVETVRRTLAAELTGRRVEAVIVTAAEVVGRPRGEPRALDRLIGRRVRRVGRRGKYLLLEFTGGPVLVVHLRMTGRLWVCASALPVEPHTHARLVLDDGRELRYRDVRRFGRLYLYDAHPLRPDGPPPEPAEPPGLFALGPEPDDPDCAQALARALRGRRAPIKALLLDQRVIAGLGNIYADEVLHAVGVHPATPAGALGPDDARRLCAAARHVLARALAHGGTTLRDYVDGRGVPGEMRAYLHVYGRAGEPCPRCGTPVARTVVAGRGTHFCPSCQPPPSRDAALDAKR